jgi:tellurium resistance protein TerD
MVEIATKGNKVNLTKENPGFTVAKVGLGWDVRKSAGDQYDLDGFLFEVGENGKITGDAGLVYFGRKSNSNGSITVGGDNLTGAGAGHDETGIVKFPEVPANVKEVYIGVSIYQYDSRRQNFGQVNNAFVEVIDNATGQVLVKYDLSEDLSNYTGITVGKFRRESDGSWSFKAVGEGTNEGMKGILKAYE